MTNDIVRGNNMNKNKWIDYEDVTGEGSNTYKCPYCNFVLQLMEGTPEENLYSEEDNPDALASGQRK